MYVYNVAIKVINFLIRRLKAEAVREVNTLIAKREVAQKMAEQCEEHARNSTKVNDMANTLRKLTGE